MKLTKKKTSTVKYAYVNHLGFNYYMPIKKDSPTGKLYVIALGEKAYVKKWKNKTYKGKEVYMLGRDFHTKMLKIS